MAVTRTRRWMRVTVGLAVVGVTLGSVAVGYRHSYRVSMFGPGALPERVHACGRSFALAESPVATAPDGETYQQVGEFTAPLHQTWEILGRPHLPACGVVILVGPDGAHLTAYSLQGGP